MLTVLSTAGLERRRILEMEMRELTRKSQPAMKTTEPVGPELTGPLRCWLLDETSESKAIEVIGKSAILKEEARRVLPQLREEALKPATEQQIKAIIGQRFALFPQPQRNDMEWASWWADYFDALKDLTAPAVEAGMAAWVRSMDAEFMCKPGKLRELARETPNANRWMRAHKIAVAATIEPIRDPEEPKTSKQERQSAEEVAAIMKDFHARMKSMEPPRVQTKYTRPTPQAQVDETGMSAEMRALMERTR